MNRRISETQIVAACSAASRVYAGELSTAEGVALLSNGFGLNETSANDFIYDYKRLMEGKVFQRAMSAPAMRHFLEKIFAEHGVQRLTNALKSLRSHIDYYEGHYNTTMRSMRAVVDEFELARASISLGELEISFDSAVAHSMRDTVTARQHRLSQAEKPPKEISVQAKAFLRNPDVVAEVLLRAAGICERCKHPAPFRRIKDGTPYLEVHHKKQLAHGGEDSVENAIALCPNCHRCVHFGQASS